MYIKELKFLTDQFELTDIYKLIHSKRHVQFKVTLIIYQVKTYFGQYDTRCVERNSIHKSMFSDHNGIKFKVHYTLILRRF